MATLPTYDPMTLPNDDSGLLPDDAVRDQRINATIVGNATFDVDDDVVTVQLLDMKGRPLRGRRTVLVTASTASWGAVAGANVFTAVAVEGLLIHSITAQRIGWYQTTDDGKLALTVTRVGDNWIQVDVGGQRWQSPQVVVAE